MSSFVVERYLAGWSPDAIRALVTQVADAGEQLGRTGVQYVRSLVLPDDETCFCVFEGPNAAAVVLANRELGLPFDRVVPVELAPAEPV